MDDEAILAGIDDEPDAFAVFYRRHVEELLEYFASRTRDRALIADLCAETFAAALDDAHRFDPERGPAVDWLHGTARRLLADARRRGAVEGRARRRLGLAPLAPGAGFVDDLEEELVAAARFRASRRREIRPRPLVLALVAALALVAVAGALAVQRGGAPKGTSEASLVVGFAQPWLEICRRAVAPELLERVAVLRRAPDERFELPQPLRRALDLGAEYRFDGVVVSGARRWGRDQGVDFWAVPVVARGSERCAPANRVCVVAVPPAPPADAECGLGRRRDGEFWRVAPLLRRNAAIYGVVPDGVAGARVAVGSRTARVGARENVIAGVLPFPYADGARVDLIRRPVARYAAVASG